VRKGWEGGDLLGKVMCVCEEEGGGCGEGEIGGRGNPSMGVGSSPSILNGPLEDREEQATGVGGRWTG
jgi:hypothetical protein